MSCIVGCDGEIWLPVEGQGRVVLRPKENGKATHLVGGVVYGSSGATTGVPEGDPLSHRWVLRLCLPLLPSSGILYCRLAVRSSRLLSLTIGRFLRIRRGRWCASVCCRFAIRIPFFRRRSVKRQKKLSPIWALAGVGWSSSVAIWIGFTAVGFTRQGWWSAVADGVCGWVVPFPQD